MGFHFTRLVGNIREHEVFLEYLSRQDYELYYEQGLGDIPLRANFLLRAEDENVEVYEGAEFSFSTPFALVREKGISQFKNESRSLLLGVVLANIYANFWSATTFPPPRIFLLDMNSADSITVPSLGAFLGRPFSLDAYLLRIDKVRSELIDGVMPSKGGVQWIQAHDDNGLASGELLAFTYLSLPDALWEDGDHKREIVVASLLDLNLEELYGYEPALRQPLYDELELISPYGTKLIGSRDTAEDYGDGLNLEADGMVFKLRSSTHDGWTGLYHLSYKNYLHHAKWPFLGGLLLVLVSLVGSILFSRWYERKVVRPARNAHQGIVESVAFSRAVIQIAPVALCVIRQDNHQVVIQNELAETWLGSAEIIPRISHEWNVEGAEDESVVQIGGRFLHASFVQTRYKGDNVILCAFNDISEHQRTQQVLTDARHSADAASEAKSVFLATITHEIRTPLYGMLGTLELLGRTALSSQQRDYLDTVLHSSSILLQLISDVLDVSKIEAGQMALKMQEFNPLELTEDAVAGYSAVANDKTLQLYACIDPDVPGLVFGDAVRIRQIINNLLNNALKFTDIGHVVVRLKVAHGRQGKVALQWQVTDTGIGMTQEQQRQLFKPFFQVYGQERTTGGAGLGLSICARLSELMGGTLHVVSETGLGSSFTFTLLLPVIEEIQPLSREIRLLPDKVYIRSRVKELAQNFAAWIERWGGSVQMIDVPPAGAPSNSILLDLLGDSESEPQWPGVRVSAQTELFPKSQEVTLNRRVSLYRLAGIARALHLAQGGVLDVVTPDPSYVLRLSKLGLRILVAEDNPTNQLLLKEQLEELGCQVALAGNGKEALQIWRPGLFDVLLTDLNMAVMSGYELARRLRQHDADLPIICLTANALREEEERCMAVGMNALLIKPVSLRTLQNELVKVCGCNRSDLEMIEESSQEVLDDSQLCVSEKMRKVFICTMRQDIQCIREALEGNDMLTVHQQIHRLGGALAVVRANKLSKTCEEIEIKFLTQPDDFSIARTVAELLERIETMLSRLEMSSGDSD